MIIKNKNIINETYKNYKITILIVSIFTIILFFMIGKNALDDNIVKLCATSILMSMGSFAVETFKKNFHKKNNIIVLVVLEIVNIIISIVMGFSINDNDNLEIIERLAICYVITTFLISVYFIIKQNKIEFPEYVIKALSNIFKTLIIYGIIALGILAILLIIYILLFHNDSFYIYIEKAEILLIGFYLVPQLINAFTNINNEIGKFCKIIVKYTLMPIIVVAFIVIYIYMLKIIISRNMPNNQVFMILSVLFAIGMLVWTSVQYLKDESLIYKISMKLPFYYIPFIFLQTYTMTLRVVEFGITPPRYVAYALILFEVIYTILFIFKKDEIHTILIAGIIIAIISLIVPKVNMIDVSNFSQMRIIKNYIQSSNHTSNQAIKSRGAYNYLKSSEQGNKYLKNCFDEDELDELKSIDSSKFSTSKHYTYSSKNSTINVEGYNKLIPVTADNSDYITQQDIKKTFSNINFKDYDERNELQSIDISNEIIDFIKTEDSDKNDIEIHAKDDNTFEIMINENQKIIIKNLEIDTNNDIVNYYYVSGYLIEK